MSICVQFHVTYFKMLINIFSASSNDCTERNANSCDECISIPDCAWCFDPVRY